MKKITYILTTILLVITGLYIVALVMRSSNSNIQLTHMINLHETKTGKIYQNLYTLLLILASASASALLGLEKFKKYTMNILFFTGTLVVFLTAYPVISSPSNKASFYENYIGEQLTIIVVIGLIIQTSYQRKKETITTQSTE